AKGKYFVNPTLVPRADDWLAQAKPVAGSWWEHWRAWLAERSGEIRAAPARLGNDRYPRGAGAPGTYGSAGWRGGKGGLQPVRVFESRDGYSKSHHRGPAVAHRRSRGSAASAAAHRLQRDRRQPGIDRTVRVGVAGARGGCVRHSRLGRLAGRVAALSFPRPCPPRAAASRRARI